MSQPLNLKEEAAKLESQLESSCNDHKLSEDGQMIRVIATTECHLLGRFLEIVKKDKAHAADVYKSNCLDGLDGRSCFNLSQLYHTVTADHREAYAVNQKGCHLGNAECCLGAALANLSDDFNVGCVAVNPSLAFDYMKRSCQLGSGPACHLLSSAYVEGIPGVVQRDLSAAFKHDFEACKQLDYPRACASLQAILKPATAI